MTYTEQQPSTKPDSVPKNKKRYPVISAILITLLLLIAIVEAVIIFQQKQVTQQMEAQSQKAYGRFLKQGGAMSHASGSDVLLRNVRYCWSKQTCIDTDYLTATAIPLHKTGFTAFDDLKSFIVMVHNGKVRIPPKTLEGMFNESVFNYPGSKLRNLTVNIDKAGQANRIKLGGSLDYIFWIPFEMDTSLKVDKTTNTLVISVYQLKVFGFIPATWLIELKPFNLQKLLTLPENKYLTVHNNLMMVKPFGLFPPPRINGKMDAITVMPQLIQLSFTSNKAMDMGNASTNSITLKGGNARFGRIQLLDADVKVYDEHPQNAFNFSLLSYLNYLPKSQVKLGQQGDITLKMPDVHP